MKLKPVPCTAILIAFSQLAFAESSQDLLRRISPNQSYVYAGASYRDSDEETWAIPLEYTYYHMDKDSVGCGDKTTKESFLPAAWSFSLRGDAVRKVKGANSERKNGFPRVTAFGSGVFCTKSQDFVTIGLGHTFDTTSSNPTQSSETTFAQLSWLTSEVPVFSRVNGGIETNLYLSRGQRGNDWDKLYLLSVGYRGEQGHHRFGVDVSARHSDGESGGGVVLLWSWRIGRWLWSASAEHGFSHTYEATSIESGVRLLF